MRNVAVRLVFVLSIALNVGALGAAAYHRFGGARAPRAEQATIPDAGPSMREELHLTDEQARAFAELRSALLQRVKTLRDQMHARRQELFAILAVPSPDPAAVDRVLREMNRTQFEVQREVADYLLAQMRLLSPEQRAALVQSILRASGAADQERHLPLLGPGGARRPDEPR